MPGCFIAYFINHLCKQTYISILSSPLDQIPPGRTVSIAVDSGGRGAHARRSDCSGSSGGAHIRCPSLIPPGPIRDSPSRWLLLGSSSDFSSTCQIRFFFKMLEMIISHCVIAQMISIFSCCNACTEFFM